MHTDISFGFGGFPGTTVSLVVVVVIGLVLVASWIVLAGSRLVQGGVVEHPQRVPQLYGYTVCLVALLVAFGSFTSIVKNALTVADPSHPSSPWTYGPEPALSSFEAFRVGHERMMEFRPPGSPPPPQLTEDDLRRRYTALRADRDGRNRAAAQRGLVISGLTFLIAVALFAFHWRWVRRYPGTGAGGAAA